ncbi:TPA: hypothetical protein N0F65_003719 [Lagenidium giganteum]|uniref:polynucleotide adenylyltransferase n=1 Tax=Lagenidium giganteum TaxID=4803 RepID=A0AAV2YZC8_9STRA|nr:TPA: hypothetical protein N0F65_003719 [Lagenidium giganteum]
MSTECVPRAPKANAGFSPPRPAASVMAGVSWKSIVEKSAYGNGNGNSNGALRSAQSPSVPATAQLGVVGHPKKLVRSRSISRIIDSPGFRKRCEVGLSCGDLRRSQDEQVNKVQFSTLPKQDNRKRHSVSEVTKNTHIAGGRERSASADLVLLRRSSLPLWLPSNTVSFRHNQPVDADSEHEQCAAGCSVGGKGLASCLQSRLCRATSVPGRKTSLASTVSESSFDDNVDAHADRRGSMLEALGAGLKKVSKIAQSGEISSAEEKNIKEQLVKSCSLNDQNGVFRVLDSLVSADEEFSELDCDDTHSESTSESSSCLLSPRLHGAAVSDSAHMGRGSMDTLSDGFPHDDEQDFEALMLLDRVNHLLAEFKAHRDYEESSALAWAVQHAAHQGVISAQLQQSLHSIISNGSWEEARDVLYHKTHLIPAVGRAVENPLQPAMTNDSEDAFTACVDELSPTETTEARHHKLRVLKLLSDLLTRWVKVVGHERGLSEEHVAVTGGSLFLAGSYRLGLNDPHSDIDAVCVVPWHIQHEDFFGSFCKLLASTDGVCQLAPVPNAYVPLISLSIHGVSMDLLFARLPMSCVEASQEIDSDHVLVGVDASSMKSLNAPRVSSMLLCLVPKRRVFRVVLRAVRAWARRRGIYSSKLGYLGGISWAILVAFVCQMYPDAEASKVFVRFFQVLSEWRWPQPIMLNMIYDAGLGFDMWDPRQNLYDRAHIMPVITPAYPHMNSAVQVTQSTFSVIYEELWRARYLAEMAVGITKSVPGSPSGQSQEEGARSTAPSSDSSVVASTAAIDESSQWSKLFQPSNFFIRYNSYLVFDFQAETTASMHSWGKFVQSRLRKLVDSLQHVGSVAKIHAFPRYFPSTSNGTQPGSCMFIGIEFQARRGGNTPVLPEQDPEVKSNLERTIRFFVATDLQQATDKTPDMQADARLLTWDELPEFVFVDGRSSAATERKKYLEDMERIGLNHKKLSYGHGAPHYANFLRNNRGRGGGPRRSFNRGKPRNGPFQQRPMFQPTQAG